MYLVLVYWYLFSTICFVVVLLVGMSGRLTSYGILCVGFVLFMS